jgi:hypothetical protein
MVTRGSIRRRKGRIPLADAPEALRRLEHKIGDPIRLILVP